LSSGKGGIFVNISDYFYTVQQAAERLSVNRITIWRWLNSGRFNVQRVGRESLIPKWEVELIKEAKNTK